MDIDKIEQRIDKTAAGSTLIDMSLGGVRFQSMMELMEFAKLMSVSDLAVPAHLRGNPGACLAICTKALRFGFDPFSLAEHSYSMKKASKVGNEWIDVETIAYDSFVIHAVIEAQAPIEGRLRIDFDGEGEERRCTVSAVPRGEKTPLKMTSPRLADLKAARGRNEKGIIKGSPLWDTKPDQQLAYDTRRDFCRRFFPEVLMGWYDKDEFDGPAAAKDVTPAKPDIAARLEGGKGKRGFNRDQIDKTIDGKADEPQSPDVRAIAYDKGAQAFDAGLPLTAHGSTDPVEIEAFADGWRARNSEVVPAEAA